MRKGLGGRRPGNEANIGRGTHHVIKCTRPSQLRKYTLMFANTARARPALHAQGTALRRKQDLDMRPDPSTRARALSSRHNTRLCSRSDYLEPERGLYPFIRIMWTLWSCWLWILYVPTLCSSNCVCIHPPSLRAYEL